MTSYSYETRGFCVGTAGNFVGKLNPTKSSLGGRLGLHTYGYILMEVIEREVSPFWGVATNIKPSALLSEDIKPLGIIGEEVKPIHKDTEEF